MIHKKGHLQLINILKDIKMTEVENVDCWLHFKTESSILIFVLEGAAELYLNEMPYEVEAGRLIFIRPGTQIRLRSGISSILLRYYQISLEQYALTAASGGELQYRIQHHYLPENGFLTSELPHRVYVLMTELLERFSLVEEDGGTHLLLKELLDISLTTDGRYPDTLLNDMLSYMNHYYDQNITRAFMAERIGFNPRYFSTYFKKQIGWSFSEHLAYVRLNKAKEYLLTTDEALNDIASKVGYPDGSYLSKKFKSLVGMSPSQFRLKRKPEKVITLQFLGDLLALGITPVASTDEVISHSKLLKSELDGVINVENVPLNELGADLIIAPTYYYFYPQKMKLLEKVAPVIMVKWGEMDLLEEFQYFGKLLGREQQAEEWIAQYKQKVTQAKQKIEKVIASNETVALYEFWGDHFIRIWDRTARAAFNLYDMLKLKPPDRVQKEVLSARRHLAVSEEQLPDYAADHMFVVASEKNGYYQSLKKTLKEHPVWKTLPAIQKQQVYFLKLEEFRFCEAYALERQLDIQVNYLIDD